MRTALTALVGCLAGLAALQPSNADDKEEKEHRARLEKMLAELEPAMEKEEWAVQRKQFIAELAKELDKAERIDLFRLNPRPLPEGNKAGTKAFHGYEIVSEVHAESRNHRKEAAAFLGKTLHWSYLRMAGCFNPRHGLRAVSGKRTLDFLICFECYRVRVFDSGEQIAELPTGFTKQKNPIDQFLRNNEKKGKDRK